MKTLKKWVLYAVLLAALAAPLSACNTVEGLGRDAKAAGEAITGAAQSTKGY